VIYLFEKFKKNYNGAYGEYLNTLRAVTTLVVCKIRVIIFGYQMKKALDYVSNYQLESACKDAICITPSKITQMIFAVLEDWYHHIVITHNFKLVSFFT